MKKLLSLILVGGLGLGLACLTLTGCMTSKVAQVGPNGTNFVTVVNEANLAIDCEGIKLGAAGIVTVTLQLTHRDATVVQALSDAHTALDGILNGANTQTTAQVADALKATGNATLTKEVTSFMASVSKVEQDLLAKYGATVAGEISRAITQAVDDGLGLGLAQ